MRQPAVIFAILAILSLMVLASASRQGGSVTHRELQPLTPGQAASLAAELDEVLVELREEEAGVKTIEQVEAQRAEYLRVAGHGGE